MKTKAAVLYEMGAPPPYAESTPLVVAEITLAGPAPAKCWLKLPAPVCAIRIFRGGRLASAGDANGDGPRSEWHRSRVGAEVESLRWVIT